MENENNNENEKIKEKQKMELTPNGAGSLITGGGGLVAFDVLYHAGWYGAAAAGILSFLAARHTTDVLILKDKVTNVFVRPVATASVSSSGGNDDTALKQHGVGARLLGLHHSGQKKEVPDPNAGEKMQLNQEAKGPSFLKKLVSDPVARMVNLGPDLQLDINDIAGKASLICGIRRSGKTTLGVRAAEEMGKFGLPMFIPDLKGDWLSLKDTLPNVVILGKGKITEDTAGKCGYAICEERLQVILDIPSFDDMNEVAMIIAKVIEGVFYWERKHPDGRTLCAIYLDEAQSFLPQDVKDSIIPDAVCRDAMLNAYMRVIAIGGSLGLFPVIMTQRIAQTSNKVIGQPELLFLLRQTMDNDVNRYKNFTNIPTDQIKALKQGQGVFVDIEGKSSIHMFHKRTSSDAMSRTPRVGDTPSRKSDAPVPRPVETRLLDEEDLELCEEDRGYGSSEQEPLPGIVQYPRGGTSSRLNPILIEALEHYKNGCTSSRSLGARMRVGKDFANGYIQQLKARKLID